MLVSIVPGKPKRAGKLNTETRKRKPRAPSKDYAKK
jgi:hypothetical protein